MEGDAADWVWVGGVEAVVKGKWACYVVEGVEATVKCGMVCGGIFLHKYMYGVAYWRAICSLAALCCYEDTHSFPMCQ